MFLDPLRTSIDYKVTTFESECVLEGTLNTDGIDHATKCMLEGFKNKQTEGIQHHITIEDMKAKFKIWNEHTSVAPLSQLHLGIWKTMYGSHLYTNATTDQDGPSPEKL
mmetsp:Transcript_21662/g.32814  ORF Transcript_21662/g.32814 Transcript_21662/m.32814 type:complete len:109 (-) Transcript_21662:365-691(-)